MSDKYEGMTIHCHPSREAVWKRDITGYVGTCRECGVYGVGEMKDSKDGPMFECSRCEASYPWPQWPRLHVDAGVTEDYVTKEAPHDS